MPTKLSVSAAEEGSLEVTMSFKDENGDAMTPNALAWTLTGKKGAVINSRSQVPVTPATTVTVVLSGNDLQYREGEKHYSTVERYFLVEGDYDSSAGSGIPVKAEAKFDLENLLAVNP